MLLVLAFFALSSCKSPSVSFEEWTLLGLDSSAARSKLTNAGFESSRTPMWVDTSRGLGVIPHYGDDARIEEVGYVYHVDPSAGELTYDDLVAARTRVLGEGHSTSGKSSLTRKESIWNSMIDGRKVRVHVSWGDRGVHGSSKLIRQ